MSVTKLLIANRGEIACRVISTAENMGIPCVAVYSDADADALHAQLASAAIHIGPSEAAASYLRAELLIEAAKKTGCDAIHPGYGFLSENAAFSEACAEAGITFVGPPAAAIQVMGDKARSKDAMEKAEVPCVPGFRGEGAEGQETATLVKAAADVGFPLLVKAAAGGGGHGAAPGGLQARSPPAARGACDFLSEPRRPVG